jgi:hypothetical protein
MNAPALPPSQPPTSGFSRRTALGALAAPAATPVRAGTAAAYGSRTSARTAAAVRTGAAVRTAVPAADPAFGPNVLGTIGHVIDSAGDPVNSTDAGISSLVSYP